MRTVAIVGCGYTGQRLALRCRALGYRVRGFATRAESLRQIGATGADAAVLDLDGPMTPVDVDGQIVYYMVPPAARGTRDERLERFLGHLTGVARRVIYLSTTGVYGDRGGASVDEDSPPSPRTERAVRRLAAESALRAWADARSVSWCMLRVPGIYGPGRLPLDRLRRAEPAIEPAQASPSNRIHVDDLVTAALAAGSSPRAHLRIYNVTDGSDDSLTAYLQRVARIAQLPEPPLIDRAEALTRFSASTWSFLGESRRVVNRRLVDELGVALAYRDLDEGIRSSL